MKWIEARVVFEAEDKQIVAELISSLFFEFDLQGVVVEDPNLMPLEGWAEDATWRPTQDAIIGYWPKDRRAEKRCKVLATRLAKLKKELGFHFRLRYRELDEENWAETWKAYFWPQKISQKIVVKPTWRDYDANPNDIVVKLDPGMAFGTGTHPTTALCINLIETFLRKDDSLLDVGTGTGILMIAAAKLGAGKVCGVDKNEMAVEIARRNLRLNSIAPQRFSVKVGNLVDGIQGKYDLVVANILTQVIYNLLEGIEQVLKDKGIFICSGILEKNENLVIARMKNIGFEILELGIKDQWVAIASRLKG
jgi:ribosomal protein L11 methyltransferase